jgi:DNA replication protein DnaC
MLNIADDTTLDWQLKRLHLAFIRRNWREVVERAEDEQWSYRDFLAVLTGEEVAHRTQTGIERRTHQARFPFLKTIGEFDFSHQSALRATMLGSYLGAEYVASGANLILQGKPGRGKTHLAIAIAYKAILNGADALFVTAAQLIEELSTSAENGKMAVGLKKYVSPGVLVIDEVGYLSLRQDAANVLYHVINRRYLKSKPVILTTNKALTQWGKVLHDEDLASAILDRILHHGRLLILDGPSQRTHSLIPGLSEHAQPVRVSGISPSDLTEPTPLNERSCLRASTTQL